MNDVVTTERSALLSSPSTLVAFRCVKILLVTVFVVSIVVLVFAFVNRSNPGLVNAVVWIRGIAVAAAAVILYGFAVIALHGRTWAYHRLRLLSFLIPCGVVLLIVAPGEFPLWMKVEQGFCGILVLLAGLIINRREVRALFSKSR
jgi:hypothetical protein